MSNEKSSKWEKFKMRKVQNEKGSKWERFKMRKVQNEKGSKWERFKMRKVQNEKGSKWERFKMRKVQNEKGSKWERFKMRKVQNEKGSKWERFKMRKVQNEKGSKWEKFVRAMFRAFIFAIFVLVNNAFICGLSHCVHPKTSSINGRFIIPNLKWIRKQVRPANNYFTWKDKCLAKPKIGPTFNINFSRTIDKVKFFIFCFENYSTMYFLPAWSC